jgi:hypothetical protein
MQIQASFFVREAERSGGNCILQKIIGCKKKSLQF